MRSACAIDVSVDVFDLTIIDSNYVKNGIHVPNVSVQRIERVTLSLGGQLVGVHVTAYDAASGGNEVSISDTGLFYFYTDHLGSVGAISDAGGAVQGDIIRYEPFGQLRSSAPSSAITDRGYTGHKENREIGLTQATFGCRMHGIMWRKSAVLPAPTR